MLNVHMDVKALLDKSCGVPGVSGIYRLETPRI